MVGSGPARLRFSVASDQGRNGGGVGAGGLQHGEHGPGPNLWGLLTGRPAGVAAGYAFSAAPAERERFN